MHSSWLEDCCKSLNPKVIRTPCYPRVGPESYLEPLPGSFQTRTRSVHDPSGLPIRYISDVHQSMLFVDFSAALQERFWTSSSRAKLSTCNLERRTSSNGTSEFSPTLGHGTVWLRQRASIAHGDQSKNQAKRLEDIAIQRVRISRMPQRPFSRIYHNDVLGDLVSKGIKREIYAAAILSRHSLPFNASTLPHASCLVPATVSGSFGTSPFVSFATSDLPSFGAPSYFGVNARSARGAPDPP